jgi:hypothetical protein
MLPCGLKYGQVLEKNGERGRNRTFNLLIKSQLLCQLSYAPGKGFRELQYLGPTDRDRPLLLQVLSHGTPDGVLTGSNGLIGSSLSISKES